MDTFRWVFADLYVIVFILCKYEICVVEVHHKFVMKVFFFTLTYLPVYEKIPFFQRTIFSLA